MDHAIAIAAWYAAQITVLHVYEPIVMPFTGLSNVAIYRGDEPEVVEPEVQRLTEMLAARCPSTTDSAVRLLVEVGKPATLIVERSASLDVDLIVIGTHGRSGFQRLVLGIPTLP
jgi:nucleotide-binding universal stress UspA family protein